MGRYAIIVVLSLLMILAFFVISNNRLSSVTQTRNILAFHQNQARNIAHSAAQIAVSQLIQGEWSFPDENVVQYFPNNNNTFVQWSDLDGSYLVSGERTGSLIELTSVGKSGNSSIEYETYVTLNVTQSGGGSFFNINPNLAVTSLAGIELTGSSRIVGDSGTYSSTPQSVNFAWSTHVDGNFFTLTGVDHYDVVKSARGAGRQGEHIARDMLHFPDPEPYPMPDFPEFPTNLTAKSDIVLTGVQTAHINENGNYDRIRVTANCNLFIDLGGEDRVLRVRDLDIQQGHIYLQGDGRLVLFVEDNFTLNGSSTVNLNGDNAALHMNYAGSPAVNPAGNTKFHGSLYAEIADVIIGGSGGIVGHIITGGANVIVSGNAEANSRFVYAPNAHVSLSGSGRIRGAVIAGSFAALGNTRVFYDEDYEDESFEYLWGSGEGEDEISVVSWK
jgi:hypothetical protein